MQTDKAKNLVETLYNFKCNPHFMLSVKNAPLKSPVCHNENITKIITKHPGKWYHWNKSLASPDNYSIILTEHYKNYYPYEIL